MGKTLATGLGSGFNGASRSVDIPRIKIDYFLHGCHFSGAQPQIGSHVSIFFEISFHVEISTWPKKNMMRSQIISNLKISSSNGRYSFKGIVQTFSLLAPGLAGGRWYLRCNKTLSESLIWVKHTSMMDL